MTDRRAFVMSSEIRFVNCGHLIKASLSSQLACRNIPFGIELKYIFVARKLM